MGTVIDSSIPIAAERGQLDLASGHAVVPRDLRSFPCIPGLTVLHW